MPNSVTAVKKLIGDGDIEHAAKQLLDLADGHNEIFNKVLLLKSQFADYKHSTMLNLGEREQTYSKIVNGFLMVADELGAAISAVGSSPQAAGQTAVPTEIMALIWLNLYGYIVKDVDLVARSIHPDSPIMSQTIEVTKQVFLHNLSYELVSIELVHMTDTEVQLKMVLITRSAAYTPTFKNNIWTGIQYLYRDAQGRWKIWAGDTIELKYI